MRDQFLLPALVPFFLLTAVAAVPSGYTSWYQPGDTPVAALFQKRYTPSPSDANFTSNYPSTASSPPISSLPAAWTAKLASITMPNVSVSKPNNGYPTYANGESGGDKNICSFTYQCTAPADLWNPPDSVVALSFDDGPSAASPSLNSFLQSNNISSLATHFMIGGNILGNPTELRAAANAGGHIGVHTWTHPYMTTLTNEQVLGELGWTMQIISDLNGGRLPKYWRPPYGDVDNRVRAIAKGVFGLETVVWNQDSADWAIGNNAAYTVPGVEASITGWLTGKKSNGLCMLEHELNNNTVGVFMNEYPIMISNGWTVKAVPDAFGMAWYQNSDSNTGPVTSMAVGSGSLAVNSSTAASSSTSSTSTTTSTTSVASTTTTSASTTSTSASALTIAAAATTTSKTGGAIRGTSLGLAPILAVFGLALAMI